MSRGEHRVFVKNLGRGCTKEDVEDVFRQAGLDVAGSWFPNNGRFCFVDFHTLEEAERSLDLINGRELLGLPLRVEMSVGKTERRGGGEGGNRDPHRDHNRRRYRLVVTGLSQQTSWQDLKDVMRGTGGMVTFTNVPVPYTGQGFAEFASEDDLLTAIHKLDDTIVDGARITVKRDEGSGDAPYPDQHQPRPYRDRGGGERRRSPPRRYRSPPPSHHRHHRENEEERRYYREPSTRQSHRSPAPAPAAGGERARREESPRRRRQRSPSPPPRRRRNRSRDN